MTELNYQPDGSALKAILLSDSFVKGIRGPFGSGKSVASCIDLLMRMLAQEREPGVDAAGKPNGPRKTRFAVIRRTGPQLKTTTINTWLDWFPERQWGRFYKTPPFMHAIRAGDIEADVYFLALDNKDDLDKLLSLELTAAWVNEAREIPKTVIDKITGRVDRYPSRKNGGPGATRPGVVFDTNSPDDDHWWPIMSGEVSPPDWMTDEDKLMMVRPENWEFFTQPPAMTEIFNSAKKLIGYANNAACENAKWQSKKYYRNLIEGKAKAWIDVYVMNRLGADDSGKPVHPDFRESFHVAKEKIESEPITPIMVGIDFGLTPAALIAQRIRGRWIILEEVIATDMGAKRLGMHLAQICHERYQGHSVDAYGDPAGDFRAQTDETTPFQIMRAVGFPAVPAPGNNDLTIRIEVVNDVFSRLVDGESGILISPNCQMLISGLRGKYRYKEVNSSTGTRYEPKPEKNQYSHVCDALQYLLLGGGEGAAIVRSKQKLKQVRMERNWNVLRRQPRQLRGHRHIGVS